MQVSSNAKHEISFFSRYVFSINSKCKKCDKKVSITPSSASSWLWVAVSVMMSFYLYFMRPPHFDYTQFIILWSLLSFVVRKYMIFTTKGERTSVNSKMIFDIVNGHAPANVLTRKVTLSVYYLFFMFLTYSIVSYWFQTSLAYSWVAYAVVFLITPIGYFDPEIERCEGNATV